MSDVVFPSIRGGSMELTRTPEWSTIRQQSVSGKELTIGLWQNPIWHYQMDFDFLRTEGLSAIDNEYPDFEMLLGFYLSRRGSYDSWLFDDPDDDTVVGQVIGAGDGARTQWQLVRDMGGFLEAIQNLNGDPTVYLDGVAEGALTINPTGLITFTSPPANNVLITADFLFYWRCRFEEDRMDFDKFAYNLWENKKMNFKTIKL